MGEALVCKTAKLISLKFYRNQSFRQNSSSIDIFLTLELSQGPGSQE